MIRPLLILALMASPALSQDIVGRASVIDGDTIEIAGQRIRFDGIDAPESWQRCTDSAGKPYRCGNVAANALDAFLSQSRPITCTVKSHDRYGRSVAVCRRSDGLDVNRWMVRNGHAIDWPRYSKGRYADDQREARKNHLGLWQGAFEPPCVVRAKRMKRDNPMKCMEP